MSRFTFLLLAAAVLFSACDEPKKPISDTTATDATETQPAEADSKTEVREEVVDTTAKELELKAVAIDKAKYANDNTPDPDPMEFIKVETEPKFLNEQAVREAIFLPADAQAEGAQGTVYLKILVGKDGKYRGHYLRKTPDKRLSKVVIDAIKLAEFEPATLAGEPTKVWYDFKYTFY